jgi:hypothetical protein
MIYVSSDPSKEEEFRFDTAVFLNPNEEALENFLYVFPDTRIRTLNDLRCLPLIYCLMTAYKFTAGTYSSPQNKNIRSEIQNLIRKIAKVKVTLKEIYSLVGDRFYSLCLSQLVNLMRRGTWAESKSKLGIPTAEVDTVHGLAIRLLKFLSPLYTEMELFEYRLESKDLVEEIFNKVKISRTHLKKRALELLDKPNAVAAAAELFVGVKRVKR